MAEAIYVERATWEYTCGQHWTGVTTIALERNEAKKPIFNLKGDQRPPDGHHFEIHLVCVPDKKEEER